MEIAGPFIGVGSNIFAPRFDIEPDRGVVVVVHAGIHREQQLGILSHQRFVHRGKGHIGLAVAVLPEQAQFRFAEIDGAERIGITCRFHRCRIPALQRAGWAIIAAAAKAAEIRAAAARRNCRLP